MVRDGFGDESGAKLIEQRGIDFAPAEDFIQTLKAVGASEAFLKALRRQAARACSLSADNRTWIGFPIRRANRRFLPHENAIARK